MMCEQYGEQTEMLPFDEGKEAKEPGRKKWPIIAAGIAAAMVGLFAVVGLLGADDNDKVPTKLLYLKDNAVMMADLANRRSAPVELTDSFVDGEAFYGPFWRHCFSKDEKYVYYMEDYNDTDYDLYRAKVAKPDQAEKISSKVTMHWSLDDNTLLYMKKNSLYYNNGKETLKFGKNVGYIYYLDKDSKYLCWAEDDANGRTYYLQDLAQKQDKVKLESGTDDFYYNETLTKFIIQKDDTVYTVDNTGKKERVAKKVAVVVSADPETGAMYYVRSDSKRLKYTDLIVDDTGMESWEKALIENEYTDFDYEELYYYDGKEEHLIAEEIMGGSIVWKYNGKYIMYKQYPELDSLSIKWSELMSGDAEDIIAKWGQETGTVLVSKNEVIGEYEYFPYVQSRFDSKAEKLYVYCEDTAEEKGIIYTIEMTGKTPGELVKFDDDAYLSVLCYVSEKGLYYLKGYEDNSGDLYLNDKQLAGDVYEADCAGDGTLVLLTNYDIDNEDGDLMYYDGREMRLIDDGVAEFANRNGSALSFPY